MKIRYFVFTVRVNNKMQTHYVGMTGGKYISIEDMAERIFGDRSERDFAVLFLTELSERDFKDLVGEN